MYGTGTGSSDAEKAAGCADIVTLAPVGPLDADALRSAIAGVTASGYTPIGSALRAAAAALPAEGPRSIVLVSDGEDTCAPPAPCDVAAELEQQGIDLTIHTVGFRVDEAARDQLRCVAEATGGLYTDADNADQLDTALQTQVDYAITGYTAQGTAVVGSTTTADDAPELVPGQYTDTFDRGGAAYTIDPGTTKYYTIPAEPGFTPYVSVTLVAPTDQLPGGQAYLGSTVAFVDEDGEVCGNHQDKDFEQLFNDTIVSPTTVLGGLPIDDALLADCVRDGKLLVAVSRIGSAYPGAALTAEIAVRMEPPVDQATVKGSGSSTAVAPPAHAAPVPATGGTSFNDATEITSGATYSSAIVMGESRYFKIPVDWGQRFAYTVTETGSSDPSSFPTTVSIDWFNPVPAPAGPASSLNTYQGWYRTDLAPASSNSSDYPVSYLNRQAAETAFFSLDGFYYLRINASHPSGDVPQSATYLLTVAVGGTPEAGPNYQLPGAATPATPQTATSPTAADSAPGTATSSSTDHIAPSSITTPAPAASNVSDPDTAGSPAVLVAAAVLAIAASAGALIWWWHRRRPTQDHR